MKKLLSCFAIMAINLCLFTPHICAQNAIQWVKDLDQAKRLATQQNKPIMLHFSGDHCPPCRRLESQVFPHPIVAQAVTESVIAVKVDTSYQRDLVKKYGVRTIPHDIIITPAGHVINDRRSPGTADGYVKFCRDSFAAYNRANASSLQVASQLRTVNQNVQNQNRARNGLDPVGQQHFIGPGQKAWSAHPGIAQQTQVRGPESTHQSTPDNSASFRVADSQFRPDPSPPNSSTFDPQLANQNRKSVANQFASTTAPPASQQTPNQVKQASATTSQQSQQTGFNPRPDVTQQVQSKSSFTPTQFANHPGQINQQAIDQATSVFEKSKTDRSQSTVTNQAGANQTGRTINSLGTTNSLGAAAGTRNQSQPGNAAIQNQLTSSPKRETPKATGQGQTVTAPKPQLPANVGIDGYCPVALMQQQKWVKGNTKWGVVHRDRTYLFSSQQALNVFYSAPDKFSPLLAGFDPVVFYHQGILKPGNRKFGAFHVLEGENNSFVLCETDANRMAFKADPDKYLNAVREAMTQIDRQQK